MLTVNLNVYSQTSKPTKTELGYIFTEKQLQQMMLHYKLKISKLESQLKLQKKRTQVLLDSQKKVCQTQLATKAKIIDKQKSMCSAITKNYKDALSVDKCKKPILLTPPVMFTLGALVTGGICIAVGQLNK